MAALVQSYPQQSASVTMLQTRPSSSSGHYQPVNSKHQRGSSAPLNIYNANAANSYRGQKAAGPVAPYAFTATPVLSGSPLRQHPPAGESRERDRGASSSVAPTDLDKHEFPALGNLPDVDTSDFFGGADVANIGSLTDGSATTLVTGDTPIAPWAKPAPNRYRQNSKRTDSGQQVNTTGNSGSIGPYQQASASLSSPAGFTPTAAPAEGSKDDSALDDHPTSKQLKRYSRRSIATVTSEVARQPVEPRVQPAPPPPIRTYAAVASTPYVPERKEHRPYTAPQRPGSAHRTSSDESVVVAKPSSRPSSSRGNQNSAPSGLRPEGKTVPVPPRGSSDIQKRLNPSPLSRPTPMDGDSDPTSKDTFANVVAAAVAQDGSRHVDSPAAAQLAALSKKDAKKEAKPSRLRRAFSFGSATELRKASAENSHNNNVAERAKLRKDQFKDEDEAREAAIVQQQEASGLGASIYSGQGNFFTGSTDNLSISSTASSASMMLRKMGKGVKKTSRSLVGLFRPKSVIGVPAADAVVPEPSVAQVSMVTVEAEREKVNVNLDPHEQVGGGTGFPKLERNSIDAARSGRDRALSSSSRQGEPGRARPSFLGGEKDRAEVLAAVKKGILKRHGTDSAASSPHQRPIDSNLVGVPRISDSPRSSGPSTPVDEHSPRGHRHTGSAMVEGEDYFASVARFGASENQSIPGTPRNAARNISFSPRIQFHDTWPSQEYDRRGDIATCNRLTPSLAQAIKEELNTFKMEMEVHESSKIYTHFF